MTTMNTKDQSAIFAFFDELFPDAGCELNYQKDYELVLAVMLSAQTTDKSVNQVTAVLFSHFPSLEALANAPITAIENDIHSIGLYKHKAANVKSITQKLLTDFSGIVPSEKEALLTLLGVGNKTANVIRAELFKIPEIAVDTHVERVSKRLGFASRKDNVAAIEAKLRKAVPVSRYIKTHHQMIHFGRYFCKAVKPNCRECHLRDYCNEKGRFTGLT